MILNHKFDSLASVDFTILDKGEIIMEYFVARVQKTAKSLATWKLYKSDREALKENQKLEEVGNIKKINVEEIKMDPTDGDTDLEIGQKYAVVKGNSEIAFGVVKLGSEFIFKLRPGDEKDQGIRAYHAKFKKSTAVKSPEKRDAENNAVIGDEKDNRLDKDTNKNVRVVNDAYYVVPSKRGEKCWTLSNSMGKVGFLLTCEREHIDPKDTNSKEFVRAENMKRVGIDTPLQTGKYYYYKDKKGNIYTFTLKKFGASKPKDGQESKTVYMVNGYPHILLSTFEKNARETLESSNLSAFNNRFGSGKKMNAVMLEKGGQSGEFGGKNYSICWSGNLIGIAGHVPEYKNAWLLIKNDKSNNIPYTASNVVNGIIGVVCDEGKNVMTSKSQPPVGCCYYCVDPKVNRAGNVMYKLTISKKETGQNSTSEGKIYEDNTALYVVEAKNIETVNGNNAPAAKGDDVNNQAGEKKEDLKEAQNIPAAPPAPFAPNAGAPVAPPPPSVSGVQPGYSGKPKANDDKEVKKEAQPELTPEKETFIESLGLNKQIKLNTSGDVGEVKGELAQDIKKKLEGKKKAEAHDYLAGQEPKKVEEKIERTQDKFVSAPRGNNSDLVQEEDEVVEAFPELKSDIDAKLAKEEKERQKQQEQQNAEKAQESQAQKQEEVQNPHPEEHPQGGNAPKPIKAVEKAVVNERIIYDGRLDDKGTKNKVANSIINEIGEMDEKLHNLGASVNVQVGRTDKNIFEIQSGIEKLYAYILETTYKNKGKGVPQNSSDNLNFMTGVGKTLPQRFVGFKETFVDLLAKEVDVKNKKYEKGKKNKKDKKDKRGIKNLDKEIKDLEGKIKDSEKEVTEKWNRISKVLRKEFEFIELESSELERIKHALTRPFAAVGKAIGLISRSDSTKIKKCFNSAAKYFCSYSEKNFKLSGLLSVFKDAKKVEEKLYDGLKKILDRETIKKCIIDSKAKEDKTKQMKVALAAVIISIMKIQNSENIVSACIGFRDGFTENIKYGDGVTIDAGDVKTLCSNIMNSDLENRRQSDTEDMTLGKAIKKSFASGSLKELVTNSEYKNIRRTIGLSQKELRTEEKQQDK